MICGSHWYGDAEEGSDWDFICQWSPEAQTALKLAGFKERDRTKEKSEYLDSNTHSVFEKEDVHAIFVSSLPLRLLAREIAKALHKTERKQRAAWNGIYAAIEHLKKP